METCGDPVVASPSRADHANHDLLMTALSAFD
jgi:hypothetical protein